MFAKYRTTKENEYVQLMASTTILKMTINGTIINNPRYYYTFPLPGEHLVYIKFSNSVSFMDLFYLITHLIHIEFLPKAKSFYINYMNDCLSLTSIDMSKIHNTNGQYFYEMFYGCTNLKEINLGGFNKIYNGYYKYDMFYNVPKDAKITIHNNFYKGITEQLKDFNDKKINN